MSDPWFNLAMLAMRSQQVIGLRMMKIAGGGRAAAREARLMVAEKVSANVEAAGKLAAGASLDQIVSGYRTVVDANAARLTKTAKRLSGRSGTRRR